MVHTSFKRGHKASFFDIFDAQGNFFPFLKSGFICSSKQDEMIEFAKIGEEGFGSGL